MKAGFFQRDGRRWEVFPAQEDVHVAGVAHGGLIGAGNPGGHGVVADDGVGHLRGIERRGGAQQTAADVFNRVAHALPGDGSQGRGHDIDGAERCGEAVAESRALVAKGSWQDERAPLRAAASNNNAVILNGAFGGFATMAE